MFTHLSSDKCHSAFANLHSGVKPLRLVAIAAAITTHISAAVINPGFEDGLTGWTVTTDPNFIAGNISAFSEGSSSARVFNSNANGHTVTPGSYGQILQTIDLSGMDAIRFDIWTQYNGTGGVWNDTRFRVTVLIDGAEQLAYDASGTFLSQEIDVTSLTGNHSLAFRLTSLTTTTGTGDTGSGVVTHQMTVDNIIAVPEPSIYLLSGVCLMGLVYRRRR